MNNSTRTALSASTRTGLASKASKPPSEASTRTAALLTRGSIRKEPSVMKTATSPTSSSASQQTAHSPFQSMRKPSAKDLPRKPRTKLPSMDSLKKIMPSHLFVLDDSLGVYYFIKDFALLLLCYVVLLPILEGYGGWPGLLVWYWLVGMVMCGIFCLGHDAIHNSLVNNWIVNDIMGHCLMGSVMVPFYPWKTSHKHHHAHTNNVDRDGVHPFYTEEEWFGMDELFRYLVGHPLTQFFMLNPIYLMLGMRDGTHYLPVGRLYTNNKERIQCIISSGSCLGIAYLAYLITGSFTDWVKYFLVPELFSGMFINLMTLLNHADDELTEAYAEEEWGYLRGQLQTIDREYGMGVNELWHHVPDGHLVHHLFMRIPHYNLVEATKHLKDALKPLDGTQYAYKFTTNYDWPLLFFNMKYKADYMIEKYRNIFYFRKRVEREEKELREAKASA